MARGQRPSAAAALSPGGPRPHAGQFSLEGPSERKGGPPPSLLATPPAAAPRRRVGRRVVGQPAPWSSGPAPRPAAAGRARNRGPPTKRKARARPARRDRPSLSPSACAASASGHRGPAAADSALSRESPAPSLGAPQGNQRAGLAQGPADLRAPGLGLGRRPTAVNSSSTWERSTTSHGDSTPGPGARPVACSKPIPAQTVGRAARGARAVGQDLSGPAPLVTAPPGQTRRPARHRKPPAPTAAARPRFLSSAGPPPPSSSSIASRRRIRAERPTAAPSVSPPRRAATKRLLGGGGGIRRPRC